MLSIIVAVNKNLGIGLENKLLYWLPNDLKRFKALTTGHPIIMGRKTFESLPKGALPNRRNIVLTRQELQFKGAETFHTLEEALAACNADDEAFCIGGASLYQEAMHVADRLYITKIEDAEKKADVFFPTIDATVWQEKSRECYSADEKHLYSYSFVNYERIK